MYPLLESVTKIVIVLVLEIYKEYTSFFDAGVFEFAAPTYKNSCDGTTVDVDISFINKDTGAA